MLSPSERYNLVRRWRPGVVVLAALILGGSCDDRNDRSSSRSAGDPTERRTLAAPQREEILRSDQYCSDLLGGLSVSDFIAQHPNAREERTESNTAIGYQQFREGNTHFGFLDNVLVVATFAREMPPARIDTFVERYSSSFGVPHFTELPAAFRPNDVVRHWGWRFDDLDLEIRFTENRTPSGETLFVGWYRTPSREQEMAARLRKR